MEPSDYYPDDYYRVPPDDPQPDKTPQQLVSRATGPEHDGMVRHRGRAEHFHVPRARRVESSRMADWDI